MRNLLCLAAILALGGCANPSCPLPGTRPMTTVSLYFGRDIEGRGMVTDAEWSRFSAKVIEGQFPDGFTSFDAAGQWRNPRNGLAVSEPTKVVQIVVPASFDLRPGVAAVVAAYKRQYRQLAVGIVSIAGCGAF
jgi:hypothetical protein